MLSIATILLCAASVFGHGHTVQPVGFQGRKSQTVSANRPCIVQNIAQAAQQGQSTTVTPGQAMQITWFIQNNDGAGPLAVKISQDGGKTFNVNAQVTTQVPGNNGIADRTAGTGNKQLVVQIPQNLNCGAAGCIMQVKQATRSFGSCFAINTGAGNQGAANVAPPPPAANVAPPVVTPLVRNNNRGNVAPPPARNNNAGNVTPPPVVTPLVRNNNARKSQNNNRGNATPPPAQNNNAGNAGKITPPPAQNNNAGNVAPPAGQGQAAILAQLRQVLQQMVALLANSA